GRGGGVEVGLPAGYLSVFHDEVHRPIRMDEFPSRLYLQIPEAECDDMLTARPVPLRFKLQHLTGFAYFVKELLLTLLTLSTPSKGNGCRIAWLDKFDVVVTHSLNGRDVAPLKRGKTSLHDFKIRWHFFLPQRDAPLTFQPDVNCLKSRDAQVLR